MTEESSDDNDSASPSRIAALLRGEPVDSDALDHAINALQRLAALLSGEDSNLLTELQTRALASKVSETLKENVDCIAMNGRLVNHFRFGDAIKPLYLDELAKTAELAATPLSVGDLAEYRRVNPGSYFQSWFDSVVPVTIDTLLAAGMPAQREVQPSQVLLDILRDAQREQSFKRLKGQAQAAVQSINEWGKARLAQTFVKLDDDEGRRASHWNCLVMLFVTLGIALPLGFIFLEFHNLHQTPTTISILLRTLIGLPMFALATYSGRISAQHRRLSQHLKVLVAQINSVKAYITGLDDAVQQEIIVALGKRAFSDPGVATPKEGTVGVPPEDFVDMLEKAAKAIKEIRK